MSLSDELRSFERREVEASLRRNNGNKSAAARDLGMTRQCLNWKLKKWEDEDGELFLFEDDLEEVSEEAWAQAVQRGSSDVNLMSATLLQVEQWLSCAEEHGHVSPGAAMGLRAILSESI